ncbi:TasA family protein [Cytobacillus firmus]|uniref:Putative spore coat-associated protein n=1 Tax=Cytobacillus firmus TaxID=1399 RepID=A0A800MTQ0_CYTFI|nr:TasA family protein [Cytobacillus firmus]KAF0822216.1 putative spore coat-associated protein [Cytobacillus firmus]
MSIKKKLGLGLASAALGISLVGGGTFAYFSDEATIHNGFAAGTLNLEVGNYPGTQWPINFDLQNLRPGDKVERTFDLKNTGTLAIEDTYLDFAKVSVNNTLNTGATDDDFLNALQVSYFVETVTQGDYNPESILINSQTITLKDAIEGNYSGKIKSDYLTSDGKLNLTPDGIDAGSFGRYRIMVHFPETNQPQNKLQGMVAKVDFNLDARQVMGNKNHPNAHGPNGTITGNGTQGLNDYTVTPDGNGLVNPDTTDKPAWKDGEQ